MSKGTMESARARAGRAAHYTWAALGAAALITLLVYAGVFDRSTRARDKAFFGVPICLALAAYNFVAYIRARRAIAAFER